MLYRPAAARALVACIVTAIITGLMPSAAFGQARSMAQDPALNNLQHSAGVELAPPRYADRPWTTSAINAFVR
jgi:hypothetical protein